MGRRANLQTGASDICSGFDQLLVADDDDPSQGLGVFGNLGISDGNPNPIRAFWNAGIAVKSPIASRASVTLGLAYYDLISSHALQTLAPPQIPFHNEQGFEFYYSVAITKWWTMTLDIHAADPARSDAKSPLLFGLRAQIVF